MKKLPLFLLGAATLLYLGKSIFSFLTEDDSTEIDNMVDEDRTNTQF
ncbi:hypothetical protein QMO72_10175 [Staphylococcus casei]|nr:hypothetical protein [Staphylococcus casei]WJE85776.1 hypothetical protein QMO72_10175 [Staphylococcus casei]